MLRRVYPLPLRKVGCSLAAWLKKSLSLVTSPSLIEVSSEHTPITYLWRKGSLDDLATMVDASEIINTADVGTVYFTTVFSGARSKCFPIQCFWFSDTFKRGETHAGHICSEALGDHCETLESVQLSQMEKERILSEQTSFHDFFEKKVDRAFQEELRLRQDYLKRRLNRTEENGECHMLTLEE